MAARLVLHIGVQKPGTTYVQKGLEERAEALARLGVAYPDPPDGPLASLRNHHETATYGLLGTEYPWVSEQRAAAERPGWEWLRDRVGDWPGTVIVSAEALSVVRAGAAQRVVDALDVADVRVVITARGLGRLLPSSWQQHVRNGRAAGFVSYLDGLREQRERGWAAVEKEPEHHLWRAFGLGRLAARWAEVVGTDRVVLVCNPGAASGALWDRFLRATGLDGAAGPLPDPPTGVTVHSGVTAAEAEVLRALNTTLVAQGRPHEDGVRLRDAAVDAFRARVARGPRITIPGRFRERVAGWSAEDVDELRASGVEVVGDLAELLYTPESDPPAPTATEVAQAAAAALAHGPVPAPSADATVETRA